MGLAAMTIVGLGLLAGLLIGAAGIGGVILVPCLVYFANVPVHAAVPAATMSFILTGLIGTLLYARAKSIRWEMAGWLSAGAMPAALAGASAANLASGAFLEAVIGLLTVLSGLNALLSNRKGAGSHAAPVSNRALLLAGAITGFASALTGTGGPLVLVPLLMWLDCPVLTAIGLSQVIQLPISLLATAQNFYNGNLDPGLGGLLALGVPPGIWAGTGIAHMVPQAALRRMVSILLVSVGALIFSKIALRLVT
jgi:uncharacterized protein